MRTAALSVGLATLLLGVAAPMRAQILDARRVGMGGLSLQRDGNLRRYNPAYQAVPARTGGAGPKATIPIPLGLIQFFHDHPISQLGHDPAFSPDSSAFNAVELANTLLNLPIFLEVKKAPVPTNDVIFTIARDTLIVDLGKAQQLVPADQFGFGGSSRPLDLGLGVKGVQAGVAGFLQYSVGFTLGDSLRTFLKQASPAHPNTPYTVLVDGIAQGGFAPQITYAGRIAGDSSQGFYLGGAVRYYVGVAYGHVIADTVGFTTGNPIFAGNNPVNPALAGTFSYSKAGNAFGHGVGGDVGVVWISGPLELGVGVNDIGATLTWSDTRIDHFVYDTATNKLVSTLVANHVTTKTKLPVSYVANVAYVLNDRTTLGADILDRGRGTVIHVGGEQRVGLFVVRGGVARDERKKVQFGWGGGVRFGSFGLDVGFWTHSNSLSNVRGVTMATSLAIY